MTINIFMHIYIGENAHWDIYAPPWQKHYTIFFFNFCYFFIYFRCILLQISHQKCFFISISIPGRSGVNIKISITNIGAYPHTHTLFHCLLKPIAIWGWGASYYIKCKSIRPYSLYKFI